MKKASLFMCFFLVLIPSFIFPQETSDYSRLFNSLVNIKGIRNPELSKSAIKLDQNSEIRLLIEHGLDFASVLTPYFGKEKNLKALVAQLANIKLTLRSAKDVDLFQKAVLSTALIIVPDLASGAGFIIDNVNGLIVTNYHVTKGMKNVLVAFYDENIQDLSKLTYYSAKVIKYSAKKDVAILKLEKSLSGLQQLMLSDMLNLKVGEEIHTIGHPQNFVWTYSKGMITGLRKNFQFGSEKIADVIQINASISPGNSGGPLFNDYGQVVGMVTFSESSQLSQNLNFAVSSSDIKKVLNQKNNEDNYLSKNLKRLSELPLFPLTDVFRDYNSYGIDTDKDGTFDYYSIRDKQTNEEIFRYLKEEDIGEDPNLKEPANILIMDLSKEKNIILYFVDTNLDKKFEMIMIDLNCDNAPDIIGVDTEGKGKITSAWIS